MLKVRKEKVTSTILKVANDVIGSKFRLALNKMDVRRVK